MKATVKHPQRKRVAARRRRQAAAPIVVASVVVTTLAVAAVLLGGGDDPRGMREFAPVQVQGGSLPLEKGRPDPAVGMPAPTVRGVDFGGHPVAIEDDGRAKAIMLLAHWCPHCREELPLVVDWLDRTGGVDGVDIYAVSTWADESRPNWPPSKWFSDEGWIEPVVVDDEDSSVAAAFGLRGTPLWVFVRRDNTVAARISGEVPTATIEAVMRGIAAPDPN